MMPINVDNRSNAKIAAPATQQTTVIIVIRVESFIITGE